MVDPVGPVQPCGKKRLEGSRPVSVVRSTGSRSSGGKRDQ